MSAADRGRRLPGWLVGAGWGVLGLSAAGLPVALVVAGLDLVRREGGAGERGIVLAVAVLGAIALVVAVERGIGYALQQDVSLLWIALGVLLLVAVVVLGVLLPGLGLVLVAVGLVLAVLVGIAGLGLIAWWRWRTLPATHARLATPPVEVRAAAERRREAVRARHESTRRAVAAGLIGPGFTRRS